MLEASFITLYRLLMTLVIVLAKGSVTAQFSKQSFAFEKNSFIMLEIRNYKKDQLSRLAF